MIMPLENRITAWRNYAAELRYGDPAATHIEWESADIIEDILRELDLKAEELRQLQTCPNCGLKYTGFHAERP